MPRLLTDAELIELEFMIDQAGIENFLSQIADTICHGKADHVRTNWQDHDLAGAWVRIAARLVTTAEVARQILDPILLSRERSRRCKT